MSQVRRLAGSTRHIRRYSSSPLSFTSNANVYNFENERLSREELEAQIPNKPEFTQDKLYTDIVSPKDVCDLVLQPTFEDILITSLAKDAPLSGNPSYQVTSKSPVSATKFLFANLTALWIEQLNSQILTLSELPEQSSDLNYQGQVSSEIEKKLTPDVLDSYANLEASYEALSFSSDLITIEKVTTCLLQQDPDAAKYSYIMSYLAKNVHSLNRHDLTNFAVLLLNDVSTKSADKIESFDRFFGSVLQLYPTLPEEFSADVLDRLAFLFASSSNLATARELLALLVSRQIAPRQGTFELFASRYAKAAQQQDLGKQQILRDLSCLKSVLFHRGMDSALFQLLLARVIDNSYDLAHFVKLACKTKDISADNAAALIAKFRAVQKTGSDTKLMQAVQLTQLVRQLQDSNVKESDDFKAVVAEAYSGLRNA